jgi:hypothetical protein
MDVITIGKSSFSRQKITRIAEKIKEQLKANSSKYKKASNVDAILP